MNNKHLFIAVGLVYLLAAVYIGLNSTITGYVIYEDKSYNFDFSNQSNFIFDNNLIMLSNGEFSLVPYYNITNITEDENFNSYIDYAEYQEGDDVNSIQDITSKLKSQGGDWVNFRVGHIFNIKFDRNLSNNDVIRFYLKGDNEQNNVRLYICKYEACDEDYGNTNYIFIPDETSGGAWSNLTLENLNEGSDRFSLRFDENASNDLRVDYIDSIHYENKIITNTEIYYPENASIETNNLIIDGLWKYYGINYSGDIKIYYSIGGNWNLLEGNNLSFINSSNIKFKLDLESDGSSSPVLSNFIVYYYGIIQENTNLTDNQTNITLPEDNFNETNVTLPENTTNVTQPELPAPSLGGGSGGGGGGGGGGSSNEEIITPANNTVQTTSSNRNELNKIAGETNEETIKGTSNVLGNQSIEPAEKSVNLALLTGRAVINDIRNNIGLFIILGLIILYYIYLKYKGKKKRK